ncbi:MULTISPECIES: hypothetical protein [Streptomyces]|uniref:hypothetical protein n=1 Tax=Streptomyces TaxID=1883 RepID=UPI000E025082|nr:MULTISPECIES: hypothetical protein [Streptomyces]MBT3077077.1 hypothetical protein [Streptomyces sp. COG21]MBT3082392.1 hypothetical protein [Streptomyces sp. COG20]MBT3090167.1 hypothetical protein [Streptomyces sp. CYG21]MBT3097171.1 hypothetical protein [Streptomyces sp. CBG30]MBT3104366.1 hypothetical protein [Streptomyces sp. COG19]
MDDVQTTMTPAVHVVEPPLPPRFLGNCDVCAALVGQRAEAAGFGDWSKVTDINVEIGRHHDRSHG